MIIQTEIKNEKFKIIALASKIQSNLRDVIAYLTSNDRVSEIIYADANKDIDTFLKKIVDGDILEAHYNDNKQIIGIDKTLLFTDYIYVGIFTAEQIENLMENSDVEVFPIFIDIPFSQYLQEYLQKGHLLDDDIIIPQLKKMITEITHYDMSILEIPECLCLKYKSIYELQDELIHDIFKNKLLYFNNEQKILTNLDNFI